MKYHLLAWSEGNCAAKAGQQQRSCPYRFGPMREAWIKGFDHGRATAERQKASYSAARARRLAA